MAPLFEIIVAYKNSPEKGSQESVKNLDYFLKTMNL